MKLKKVNILGYRQLKNVEINMDNNVTVIAGANNCGKTSLVELFNIVFGNGKISYDDLSIHECRKWQNIIFPLIADIFNKSKDKIEHLTNTDKLIFPESNLEVEKNSSPITIPPICIKIHIDYKDSDDIRNFSDYLMDFDPNMRSFFFMYEYSIDRDLFKKALEKEYDKIFSRMSKYNSDEEQNVRTNKENEIKLILSSIYAASLKEKTFYSDSNYHNIQDINLSTFKSLFNYCNIFATRILDDSSTDKNKLLSRNMIDIASKDADWDQKISQLPDQILAPIQTARIPDIIKETSLKPLEETIQAISKTNGGHTGNLSLDVDISEDSVKRFINNVICAKYQLDDCQLSESSQGLGYSNLIYIHLQIEKYKKSIDPLKVNFFIIEEPEAHMHPQMQSVFTNYLFNYYATHDQTTQCLVTTHSNEVIRGAKTISKLRVLRRKDRFECNLFDLKEFHDSLATNKELIEFYDFFFTINFPDIIFADKILMYEGDTERMFISSLLSLEKFESLKQQYIAFVQVGGAYAFNYKELIEFLSIKTVILTDIDYGKSSHDIDSILGSQTTNATINTFAKQFLGKESPTVTELYNWQEAIDQQKNKKIILNNLIYLAFQGKKDHYSRTLEEAMLSKLYGFDAFDIKEKSEWATLRESNKLKFSLPQKKESSIRDIVHSTSNNKTDFMYSVLLNNKHEDMLPNYIEEALKWLVN